ncbi:MAG: pyridoxamine kinase [Firmicutes bacterium]|nr:pyridoxamine kinase [Bacillota bacterium]
MRVLAINDISCVGKCSLTVALPVVSACGVTCDVLPTALLSTHTGGFEGYTFRDLSDEIPAVLKHWESLGLTFDFIYSGYLGNVSQIETVREIKRRFLKRNGKFIVDPVMGDGGKLYAHFDFHFVEKMRVLCEEADFILPNVTEACLLAGENYPLSIERLPAEKIVGILRSPHTCPIVTGVEEGEENAVYYGEANGVSRYALPHAKGFFHGAGDVFAAAFTGCLARGKSKKKAIELAANFTTAAIFRTAKAGGDSRYGLLFEEEIFNFLKELAEDEKE